MRRRPSLTYHRAAVIRGAAVTLVTGSVLGLVLWLPIDRATVVAGMAVSVIATIAPTWKNATRSPRPSARRRPPSHRGRIQ